LGIEALSGRLNYAERMGTGSQLHGSMAEGGTINIATFCLAKKLSAHPKSIKNRALEVLWWSIILLYLIQIWPRSDKLKDSIVPQDPQLIKLCKSKVPLVSSFLSCSLQAVGGAHAPRRQPSLLVRSGGNSAREAVEPHRRLPRTRS
jgi:hypothetical protein